jgi:uncharacterized protein YggE
MINSRITSRVGSVLTVQGKAIKSSETDLVYVSFEVVATEVEAVAALASNNQAMQSAIDAIIKAGVKAEDITTMDFSLGPKYNWSAGNKIFQGYEVRNSFKVKLSNLDIGGSIIDAAVNSAKGVNVNSVRFAISPDKQKTFSEEMIKNTIKDAYKEAELALKTINFKIDGLISIDFVGNEIIRPMPIVAYAAESMVRSAVAKVNLFANKQDLDLTANIKFKISEI